jgi:hypothetical protein
MIANILIAIGFAMTIICTALNPVTDSGFYIHITLLIFSLVLIISGVILRHHS